MTFSVANSNSSVLNLAPTSLAFGTLLNGTTVSQNLSLSETTGTSGNNASYTGITAGNFTVTGGSAGTVSRGATNTLATTYSGSSPRLVHSPAELSFPTPAAPRPPKATSLARSPPSWATP